MAIYVRPNADPFSLAAQPELTAHGQTTPILATSAASQLLANELGRYCRGEIKGRSFLVGGHRGSGKTTMLDDLLLRFHREALQSAAQHNPPGAAPLQRPAMLKPLPVYLLGPALFDDNGDNGDASAPAARNAPAPATASATVAVNFAAPNAAPSPPPHDKDVHMTRRVLVQAVLGLHHAVSQEFFARFGRPEVDRPDHDPELAELVAQFRIELNEAPSTVRLREFWRRIDKLQHGVLFPGSSRRRQGWLELVALNGISHVYQRVTGILEEQRDERIGRSRQDERATGLDVKWPELAKSLTAFGSGAAVAAAGVANGHDIGGPLAGLLTAVVGGLFFRFSSTTTTKRESNADRKFVPDLTVKTLYRVIPDLLERLRSAGMAPVFVVDELDKVDDLARRIDPLVRDLKKLFAESSFTCLLVDRGYYEYLLIRDEQERHGTAPPPPPPPPPPNGAAGAPGGPPPSGEALGRYFSYFSHRVFVAHRPVDLHRYLQVLLEVREQADNDNAEVLRWVLLHRARLNPLLLNRAIEALRGSDNQLLLPAQLISITQNRIELTLQFAVELALGRPEVRAWVDRRPRMQQPVVDAAYYVSACFGRDQAQRDQRLSADELDLGDSGRAAFEAYLLHRMNLYANESPPDDPQAAAAWAREREAIERQALSERDVRRLYAIAQEVGETLGWQLDKGALKDRWEQRARASADGMPAPSEKLYDHLMLGAMVGNGTESITRVLRPVDPSDRNRLRYRWVYLPSGEQSPDYTRSRLVDEATPAAQRWEGLLRLLGLAAQQGHAEPDMGGPLLQGMIERYHLMRSSAGFQALDNAAKEILKPDSDCSTAELASYAATLREFDQNTLRNPTVIESTVRMLVCAAAIEGLIDLPHPSPGLAGGMEAVAGGLYLERCQLKQAADRLRVLHAAIRERIGETMPEFVPPGAGWPEAEALGQQIAHAFHAGEAYRGSITDEDYWHAVAMRLQPGPNRAPSSGAEPASLSEMQGWLKRAPDDRVVDLQLDRMTLRRWSTVLRRALDAARQGTPSVPFWMAAHALERLGAGSLDADTQRLLLDRLTTDSAAAARVRIEVANGLWPGHGTHSRAALVVAAPTQHSHTHAWPLPPAGGLVIEATAAELIGLLDTGLAGALRDFDEPLRLAIEHPGPTPDDMNKLNAALQKLDGRAGPRGEPIWIYGPGQVGRQARRLDSPRSDTELWSLA